MEFSALITVEAAVVAVILATMFVIGGSYRPRDSERALHILIGVVIGSTVVGLAAVAAFFIFD